MWHLGFEGRDAGIRCGRDEWLDRGLVPDMYIKDERPTKHSPRSVSPDLREDKVLYVPAKSMCLPIYRCPI